MPRVIVFVLAFLSIHSLAGAQVAQRPARPTRGLFGGGPPQDPNRTRQDLSLTGSFLGGYDEYLSPSGATGPQLPGATSESGWAGIAETTLSYFYGRTERFFSFDGRAVSNTYSGVTTDSSFGGDVSLTGSTEVGRRNALTFRQDFAYLPSLLLGGDSLGVDALDPALPPVVSSGVLDERSLSIATGVTFAHNWTPRQATSFDLSHTRQTYLDNIGHSTLTTEGSVQQTWNLTRTVGLTGSYRYSDALLGGTQDDDTGEIPLRQHALEGGVTYSRRISPTRTFRFAGSLGATRADTLYGLTRAPLEDWTPSGHVSLGADLGRTWVLNVNYFRSIDVLQGVELGVICDQPG